MQRDVMHYPDNRATRKKIRVRGAKHKDGTTVYLLASSKALSIAMRGR